MNALAAAAALAVLLAAAAPDECVWKEPKEPPAVKEGDSLLFTAKWDRDWFKCAKKAGGTLTVQHLAGEPGKLAVLKEAKVNGANATEWFGGACKQDPKPTAQQVKLVGTGPMERLSWQSSELEIFCPRCPWAGDDNMLVVHTAGFSTEPGQVTFEGKLDEGWVKCAREGSALEMRFFLGGSRAEVQAMEKPVFVVKGLEGQARFKKKFPRAQLCEGNPGWLGYELHGTGEMRRVNGAGRSFKEGPCR